MIKDKLAAGMAIFKLMLASVIFLFLTGFQTAISAVTTLKVIAGFSSPESVIADAHGRYFFVSNVGKKLAPSAKDGDGFISRLSPQGDILDKKYLPKTGVLNAPKGMAIINQILFVADIDRVVGFNLLTREQTFELDFSSQGTMFLNDLAVVNKKTLVVSATDTGKIYEISLGEKPHFTLLAENIPGANGLYFDSRTQRLFVVTFGEGYKSNGKLGVISLRHDKHAYQALTGPIGGLDGVALLDNSKVIFSDWVAIDKPGLIRTYNLKTKKLAVIDLPQQVYGPADFFYDTKKGTLWIPEMEVGKVLVEKLPKGSE